MIIKVIEVRDSATFIPALAIKMEPETEEQRYLFARVGFRADDPGIVLMRLNDQEAHSDPYAWRGDARTMPVAHSWLLEHFDHIAEGDVVDVQVILGETVTPKVSERLTDPLD